MYRREVLKSALATAAVVALVQRAAHAQDNYPDRPVRLVVPFAAGGSTDVTARKFAVRMSVLMGQTFVVENRVGASGALGSAEAARAKPDGFTLQVGTSGTHTINPSTMVKATYDAVNDFAPIYLLSTQSLAISVHPSVPANSIQQLIALIKANPGKYAYASNGAGGIAHFAAELFREKVPGLDMLHVPFKGGGPAAQAVIAGHVPILFDTFGGDLAFHRAGQLRILAGTGEQRVGGAPEIPTVLEAGIPDYVAISGTLFLAPAKVPQPVLDKLFNATKTVMADKGFIKELQDMGTEPVLDSNPEKARQFIKREIARWAPIIRKTGVTLES